MKTLIKRGFVFGVGAGLGVFATLTVCNFVVGLTYMVVLMLK